MTFPSYKEIEIPLLVYINKRGGDVIPKECYTYLAKEFELSDSETSLSLSEVTRTERSEAKWNNMVQWARKSLVDDGYLFNAKQSGFGKWKITNLGKEKAKNLINKIEVAYPDDVEDIFFEGVRKQINVNRYERSKTARDKCIDHYGCLCSACGLDFKKIYGEIGTDFIHVHHIKPISEIGIEYELDPVKDLRPVCPNCHAMIHRTKLPVSIEEMKKVILKNKN
jgi:5-methylcytosine-specific restriction protein A